MTKEANFIINTHFAVALVQKKVEVKQSVDRKCVGEICHTKFSPTSVLCYTVVGPS